MTKHRFTGVSLALLAVISLFALLTPIQAALAGAADPQTYSFTVTEMLMDVTVLPEGATRIVYDITFENAADPIDIVDIGTPNEDYDLSQMTASIDGQRLTDIRTSTYIDTGVEIHLGSYAIDTFDTGTLRFEFVSPDMVYADTTNEENASLQITPTWFDDSLITGPGNIEIRIHMLPGIDPDEVLWQDEEFIGKYKDERGNAIVVWRYENVRPTEAYRVGVSFPRRGLTQVQEVTFWDIAGMWIAGILPFIFGCLPIVVIAGVGFLIVRAIVRASRPDYLPPIAQTEGGGIKRGLTAPEAAVLIEVPLTKVLTLVVFGMLEKGLIRQTDDAPLTVEVVEDFRVADQPHLREKSTQHQYRRRMAQQAGTIIHRYEQPFLDLIEAHPDTAVQKLSVVKPMKELVDGVAEKMRGFDLSDTQDYYRRVIERAMEQASKLGDIKQREAYLDKYAPWVMMDKGYRPVMTMGGYHYWPMWARQIHAGSTGSNIGGAKGRGASGGRASTTTFGDVSASFAGWAETTMGGMAAAILPTGLSKPAPPSTSSGSSYRGGSSCACACAGCACACACAGGGR